MRHMKTLAALFKSLEDETRLRIMGLLLDVDELCVCHIIAVLQLPQSTVSRHLATLKNAGWLNDRREGLWIFYSLSQALGPVQQALIPPLRTLMAQNEAAGNDRERLAKLRQAKRCD